jgi:NADH-quinone oxidoreductase subunit L
MGISTLAIAGVPPFSGFFSKDEIIGAAWNGAQGHSFLSGASLFGIEGRVWMGFIGGTLSIAAFMTAFYMGRMMIYTFFGANRTGDEERKHLHETDWTLKLPLIVLGLLAAFGGFLNVETEVPVVRSLNVFGTGEALHHWLEPVIAGATTVAQQNVGELGEFHHAAWPIILAIVIGLGGLATAWLLLSRRVLGTADREPAYDNGIEKTLYNKWYVDEAYDAAVVRPVGGLSRLFARFDMGVLDWVVDLCGRLAQLFGVAFGRLQTGQLNTYAFVLVVGVLIVLGSFVAL